MKRILIIPAIIAGVLMINTISMRAQFGPGVGLAAIGDNVNQAGGDLGDLLHKQNLSAGDVSGNLGFYVSGRARIKLDPFRLIGDVSYVYFPSSQIKLTSASANPSDTSGSATFEVGTTMIPIAAGATFALPLPVVKPYVGAELSYTAVSRTYTFVSGSSEIHSLQIDNKSAGDPEFGMILNLGVEFDLVVTTLDVGARYNMMNLFTMSDQEKPMRYLQVGASLFF